jgi:hypothetical protein
MLIAYQFKWQIQGFKADDPTICRTIFCSNQWIGVLILVAFIWGYWFSENL